MTPVYTHEQCGNKSSALCDLQNVRCPHAEQASLMSCPWHHLVQTPTCCCPCSQSKFEKQAPAAPAQPQVVIVPAPQQAAPQAAAPQAAAPQVAAPAVQPMYIPAPAPAAQPTSVNVNLNVNQYQQQPTVIPVPAPAPAPQGKLASLVEKFKG